MKSVFTILLAMLFYVPLTQAQITITASDMPVANDTLRSSSADPATVVDLATTGANQTWDFSNLTPTAQTIDTYVNATSVSLLLFSLSGSYGIHSNISGLTGGIPLPVPITDVYFFNQKRTGPSRWVGRGYGATISGLTAPIAYSDEDEIFYFPLQFNNHDSSTYALSTTIPSVGDLKIIGNRVTTVDGWGTIKTPYYTTPVSCIRVRSVATEIDSITYNSITFGIPRTTVDYKWLNAGNHYPHCGLVQLLVLVAKTLPQFIIKTLIEKSQVSIPSKQTS